MLNRRAPIPVPTQIILTMQNDLTGSDDRSRPPKVNLAIRILAAILGAMVGVILGVVGGFLSGRLHAPAAVPGQPLANEWWIIAEFFCAVGGAVGGAFLGILIGASHPHIHALGSIPATLLGIGLGCLAGIMMGQVIHVSAYAAFFGTAISFFGGLAGFLMCVMYRAVKIGRGG